jgi:hypothetical protein
VSTYVCVHTDTDTMRTQVRVPLRATERDAFSVTHNTDSSENGDADASAVAHVEAQQSGGIGGVLKWVDMHVRVFRVAALI